MSKFTPLVTREFEVDGDKVQVRFRRLTRKQFGIISPYAGSTDQSKIMEMLDVVEPVLTEVVHTMTGLTDSEDKPMSLQETINEAYFLGFITELLGTIVEESVLDEKKQAKSSEKQASI